MTPLTSHYVGKRINITDIKGTEYVGNCVGFTPNYDNERDGEDAEFHSIDVWIGNKLCEFFEDELSGIKIIKNLSVIRQTSEEY